MKRDANMWFQDPDNDEGEVFASRYDDKGQLIPIESEAEWEMVEEVINTFVEDEEKCRLGEKSIL